MCAVSVLHDYWSRRPVDIWTRPAFDDLQEVMRRLEALDHQLAQPDCDDPSKAEWMQRVEERLQALEAEEGSRG